jgi:flavin-dependent dehydrogenase
MVADVAIVGGGPAGSALAIELGRRGMRVALYEKARHPRRKACGEGLLPHGVMALRDIAGLPDAPRVSGLRYSAGGRSVDADFSEGFGLVVRRDRFDAWLFEKAAGAPNVDARPGVAYRGDRERFVVGADGAHSMFHRRLKAIPATPRRVGLSAHLARVHGLGTRVEVFLHDDGELYLAPTGGGEALVAALFYQSRFRRDGLVRLLSSIPELRDRIAGSEFTSPVLAAAPLGLHVPRVVDDNLLLIGDAAGAPDPITGDGMALALVSVKAAAEAIVSGNLRRYQRARLEAGRTAERFGRLMLGLTRKERLARLTPRVGRLIAPVLLDVAVGRRSLTAAGVLSAFSIASQVTRS